MSLEFFKIDAGRGLHSDVIPSDFSDSSRAAFLPEAESSSDFETAIGRSGQEGDIYYDLLESNYRYHDGSGWVPLGLPVLTGLENTNLYRSSASVIGLVGRSESEKKVLVNDEYVDISTAKTFNITSDNLITAAGANSGSTYSSSAIHYGYLSNSKASYAPSTLKFSLQRPTDGLLGTYGEARNWGFAGAAYLQVSGNVLDEWVCGFGINSHIGTIGSNWTKSSGGVGYVDTSLFLNPILLLEGTILVAIANIHTNYSGASVMQTRIYDYDDSVERGKVVKYYNNETNMRTIAYNYNSDRTQVKDWRVQVNYPGSGTVTVYSTESYLQILRLTGKGFNPASQQNLSKWQNNSTVLSGSPLVPLIYAPQWTRKVYVQYPTYAIGDEFSCGYVTLQSGDYTFHAWGITASSLGILEWRLYPQDGSDDFVIVSGQDWYTASRTYNVETSDAVTIPKSGTYELRGKVTGKNASSSNYRIELTRTRFERA